MLVQDFKKSRRRINIIHVFSEYCTCVDFGYNTGFCGGFCRFYKLLFVPAFALIKKLKHNVSDSNQIRMSQNVKIALGKHVSFSLKIIADECPAVNSAGLRVCVKLFKIFLYAFNRIVNRKKSTAFIDEMHRADKKIGLKLCINFFRRQGKPHCFRLKIIGFKTEHYLDFRRILLFKAVDFSYIRTKICFVHRPDVVKLTVKHGVKRVHAVARKAQNRKALLYCGKYHFFGRTFSVAEF